MERKVVSGILSTLLFIGMITLAFNIQPTKAESSEPAINIWNDYTLTRDITFSSHGFILRANNITLDLNGHTITCSGKGAGISLTSISGATVKNGTIKNFYYGVYFLGGRNNTLVNNIVLNCHYGISIVSSGSTLRHNHVIGCTYNFGAGGFQDIDDSNTVDGKPIYYWVNQHDKQIPTDAGYVAVVNSTNITVKNLILTNNQDGVLFVYTSESRIENVTASNNQVGIHLRTCGSNVISGNTISNSQLIGIYLGRSNGSIVTGNIISENFLGMGVEFAENNTIYHNNFLDNSLGQVWSSRSTSSWDNGYPFGGNYWSDYDGEDNYGSPNQDQLGSDGIGDTQYTIHFNNPDRYPLMEPSSTPIRIKALSRTVRFWNLHKGTENSLTSKLEGALRLLDKEKENGAVHKLMAFINQAEVLGGKKLTNDQVAFLVAEAQRIIDLIKG